MQLVGVALDLDGVVSDFHGSLLDAHKLAGHVPNGVSVADAFPGWEAWKAVALDYAAWWRPATLQSFWTGLQKLPWADELIRTIKQSGTPLRFVSSTSGQPEAAFGKTIWCKQHYPDVPLTLVGDCRQKAGALRSGELLIDDNEQTVDAWRARGDEAILAPTPWNRLWAEPRASVVGMAERALNPGVVAA